MLHTYCHINCHICYYVVCYNCNYLIFRCNLIKHIWLSQAFMMAVTVVTERHKNDEREFIITWEIYEFEEIFIHLVKDE